MPRKRNGIDWRAADLSNGRILRDILAEMASSYVLHFAFCAEPENTNKSDTNSRGIRLEYNGWTISSPLGR